jgi:hypothetical protein
MSKIICRLEYLNIVQKKTEDHVSFLHKKKRKENNNTTNP